MKRKTARRIHRLLPGILCLSLVLTLDSGVALSVENEQAGNGSYVENSNSNTTSGESTSGGSTNSSTSGENTSNSITNGENTSSGSAGDTTQTPEEDASNDESQTTTYVLKTVSSSVLKRYCKAADKMMSANVLPDKNLKRYKYLYIGASRACKLRDSVNDKKTYFETKSGATGKWFVKQNGYKKPLLYTIRSYLEARPKGNVIIELGNNNLKLIELHIYIYEKLIEAYPEAHFWFVDVLPGTGKKAGGEKKNKRRIAFNERLKQAFPENCLGGYDYLLQSPGFKTVDGAHYPAYVERNLYKYLMKKIGRSIRYSGKTVIDV